MEESLPAWLTKALQGLPFWIGHHRSLFPHYPLPEAAIVAEMCKLIQAHRPNEFLLFPERMYKNLLDSNDLGKDGKNQIRADLVVCSLEAKGMKSDENISAYTEYVFEVKRGSAPPESINEDLRRLHKFLLKAKPGTRCFLIIVSEDKGPKRFVKDNKAIRGKKPIPNTSGQYCVRRYLIATPTYTGKTFYSACLLEALQ